ncbi:MAG: glycosyltransferase family 4 protein [Bacteroidetes bacterium]|nr:glycosyltransferase family 4 protein [Bacteroidota bacterium]
MKSILFLTLHRPDRSPSQRFRFEQYLEFLQANGFLVEHFYLLNERDDKLFYSHNALGKIKILITSVFKLYSKYRSTKKDTIVFVQRECFMLGSAYFEKLFRNKCKLIFDFDDSIWLQNVSDKNKLWSFLKNPSKTSHIIQMANCVVAGNQYLADYALRFNKNVTIIPTTIDTAEYYFVKENQKPKDTVCIGWSGSVTTIQHFQYVVGALLLLKKKYGDKIYFKVIGDGSFKHKELNIAGLPWKKASEINDLAEIDIGIMPLPDDEWASGKCGLKGLQYMSLGIPTIMSPVGVNSEIIKDGENGFLAQDDNEWVAKLSRLIESPELRSGIGLQGRKSVVEKYSVEANKNHYLQLFNSL